jgi:hypothetical protein
MVVSILFQFLCEETVQQNLQCNGMAKFRLRLRKSKVEAKAKVERKFNLSLNLTLHGLQNPQPHP